MLIELPAKQLQNYCEDKGEDKGKDNGAVINSRHMFQGT